MPKMESSGNAPTYLIIGAGVFGVSTALQLITTYPDASVTLVDRDAFDAESRVAASWDWNKVVRADYDDLIYCKLAIEAQDVFKNDPLWQPYFHETGVYWICRSNYARDVISNYERLGRKAEVYAVSVDEAKKLYGGLFEDADYAGVTEILVNNCLQAVTRRALKLGVKYIEAEVSSLCLSNEGLCYGAETINGRRLRATHTVLCTGAYTAKLLEHSAASSGLSALRSGSRIVAGGITTGMARLDDESAMPVGFQGYPADIGKFVHSLTRLLHLH
jgi:glycine/D-amino acid oxidase-like deaminating enzyme